ncbi:MAG: class I SAM-dependent methyltransferase [Bacillota bacterium]
MSIKELRDDQHSIDMYAEKVREAYDKKSLNFRKTDKRERWDYLVSKMLSDHFLLSKINLWEKEVLNIGCAPHPIDEIMFVRKVKRWVASDINANVLDANRTICAEELHPDIFRKMEFEVADATSLVFPDGSFDVVVAMSSLEHIPGQQWRVAMKEIYRVLRPNGMTVITMSNKLNFPYYYWSKKMQSKGCEFGYEECIYPWTMKSALVDAGLIPVEFVSNFWLTTSVWIRGLTIPFLKYFGPRMGYLARKGND